MAVLLACYSFRAKASGFGAYFFRAFTMRPIYTEWMPAV